MSDHIQRDVLHEAGAILVKYSVLESAHEGLVNVLGHLELLGGHLVLFVVIDAPVQVLEERAEHQVKLDLFLTEQAQFKVFFEVLLRLDPELFSEGAVLDHVLPKLGWERRASTATNFHLSIECCNSINELNEESFLQSNDSFDWLKSLASLKELRPD